MVAEFATLVGLLCNFRQEIGARKDATHREFVEWLAAHRHDELKQLVAQNHGLQIQIDELLRANHRELTDRLDAIAEILATLVSKMDGFGGVVEAFIPKQALPEQAMMILRQFAASQSPSIIRLPSSINFDSGEGMEFIDERFLDTDLDQLVSMELLREKTTSQGYREFKLTRNAVLFLATASTEAK